MNSDETPRERSFCYSLHLWRATSGGVAVEVVTYSEYEDLKRAQALMSRAELTPTQAEWMEEKMRSPTFSAFLRGARLQGRPQETDLDTDMANS